MMELLDDVFFRCGHCRHSLGIHREEFDIECNVYDRGENSMGDEAEYRIEGYAECPECGNEITFRISGYEYPMSAYNYEDNEIEGGEFEEDPQMGVVYSQDDIQTGSDQICKNRGFPNEKNNKFLKVTRDRDALSFRFINYLGRTHLKKCFR